MCAQLYERCHHSFLSHAPLYEFESQIIVSVHEKLNGLADYTSKGKERKANTGSINYASGEGTRIMEQEYNIQ